MTFVLGLASAPPGGDCLITVPCGLDELGSVVGCGTLKPAFVRVASAWASFCPTTSGTGFFAGPVET